MKILLSILSIGVFLISCEKTNVNPITQNEHYVGELFGGGVVLWVDHTGEHGLIVSMVDLSAAPPWSNITTAAVGTTNHWDGANNTIVIIGQTGHTSSAAQLCDDYTNADYGTGTYSDWYLPSITELNLIWNNLYEVQKALANDGNPSTTTLISSEYWSSSESNAFDAWGFRFATGYQDIFVKGGGGFVRAVRAF